MFTAPLTNEEYRILIDVKYRAGAETLRGWALRDQHGGTIGWHPYEAGSQFWARGNDAFRAFVPDTKQRRNRVLLGWEVVATIGISDLADLLRQARGETTNTWLDDGHDASTP